jgi:cell division protein FtsB
MAKNILVFATGFILMVAKLRRIKKGKKKFSFSLVIFNIILIGLIVFFAFSAFRMRERGTSLYGDISVLEKRVEELEERKAYLEERISYQESEEYIEEVARENLNLKGVGEKSVAFIMEEEEEKEEEKEEGFFENILNKIKFW